MKNQDYPTLKTSPIPQPSIDYRYKQFMAEIKPIPSSHELALIQQELRRTTEMNSQTLTIISHNQEQVQKWMNRNDPDGSKTADIKQRTKIRLKMKESGSSTAENGSEISGDTVNGGEKSKRSSISETERIIASIEGDGVKVSLSDQGNIKIVNPKPTRTSSGKNLSNYSMFLDSPKFPHIKKEKKRRADSVSVRSTPDPEQSGPAVGDYSKVKAQQNQIPIATFWGFMDQYLRNLTPEDMQSLESNGDEVTPFIIPQFGPHYRVQWEQEDAKLAHLVQDGVTNPALAINKEFFEYEDSVYDGDVQLGPFSERLLGALVREGVVPSNDDDEDTDVSIKQPRTRTKADLQIYEDRLKAELMHIGLIPKQEPEMNEIMQALLKAQHELGEQIQINSSRKKRLLPIAEEYMAYQEYQTLLADINKSVNNAYIKRFKSSNPKKVKKKSSKEERGKMPESVMTMLQARKTLMKEVGEVYFPPSKFAAPTESIYQVSSPGAYEDASL